MAGSQKENPHYSEGMALECVFSHPRYELDGDLRLVAKGEVTSFHENDTPRISAAKSYVPPDDDLVLEESDEKRSEEDDFASVNEAVRVYVEDRMRKEFGLVEKWVPEDAGPGEARCAAWISEDLASKRAVVALLQNKVGSKPGIWSRSLCKQVGLKEGTMIETIEKCVSSGLGLIIVNANTNSAVVDVTTRPLVRDNSTETVSSGSQKSPSHKEDHLALEDEKEETKEFFQQTQKKRVPIVGSSTPEEHVLYCFERFVPRDMPVVALAVGFGSSLAVDVVERQLAQNWPPLVAVAAVEPSSLVTKNMPTSAIRLLARIALAFEGADTQPYPARRPRAERRLGCPCVAVGPASLAKKRPEQHHEAAVFTAALDAALRYFEFALDEDDDLKSLGAAFIDHERDRLGIVLPLETPRRPLTPEEEDVVCGQSTTQWWWWWLLPFQQCDDMLGSDNTTTTRGSPITRETTLRGGNNKTPRSRTSSRHLATTPVSSRGRAKSQSSLLISSSASSPREKDAPSVDDFVLENIIGKTAFGKVLLVRKKTGSDAGSTFAMKVLKKKDVVPHAAQTKAERAILVKMRHPFVVKLRYAFQTDVHLYLVTDYYPGGNLKSLMETTSAEIKFKFRYSAT